MTSLSKNVCISCINAPNIFLNLSFVHFKAISSQPITGFVAVDHKGSLTAEPGGNILVSQFSNWKNAESFTLPPGTQYVVVRVEKKNNFDGGILAEFSNGYVTDSSWQCTEANSNAKNLWPPARVFALNNGQNSRWNIVVDNIGTSAKWIWTANSDHGEVWCWKSFGG